MLHGDRPDRINQNEPLPSLVPPEPPAWLVGDQVAMEVWADLVPKLTAVRVLTELDGVSLAMYCASVADYVKARQAVLKLGVVVSGRRGLVTNPAVRIAAARESMAHRWSLQFGLTPSARTGIRAGEPTPGDLKSLLS